MNIAKTWNEFNASKATLFWSCAACVVLTLIVGFSWGGWVTGGTASERASNAAEEGRAELAAAICMDNFLNAPEASARLVALKEESSYRRDTYIEENGWVTFAGLEGPIDGAAEICADQLAEAELPPTASTEATAAAIPVAN